MYEHKTRTLLSLHQQNWVDYQTNLLREQWQKHFYRNIRTNIIYH